LASGINIKYVLNTIKKPVFVIVILGVFLRAITEFLVTLYKTPLNRNHQFQTVILFY